MKKLERSLRNLFFSAKNNILGRGSDRITIDRYRTEMRRGVRSNIINALIQKNGYSSYLEIGVFKKKLNFEKINIEKKIGVDPGVEGYSEATHMMTSDDFFEKNNDHFDIVFIDGLHVFDQVLKDILNALDCLSDGGAIVCHDMNPQSFVMQTVPRVSNLWNGDCWKAFVTLRMERDDLDMFVIDADFGVGIIKKGSQVQLKKQALTYKNLEKNRKDWLNLISLEEFKRRIG